MGVAALHGVWFFSRTSATSNKPGYSTFSIPGKSKLARCRNLKTSRPSTHILGLLTMYDLKLLLLFFMATFMTFIMCMA